MIERAFASALRAPVAAVWARVSTPEGINDELGPWLSMSMPRGVSRLDARSLPLGQTLFRSWILLGGVLPIDYDDLRLVSLTEGVGFHERSSMATARVWEHRRWLRDDGQGGCVLNDRVGYEPRFALAGAALGAIVPRVFAHRHRRLRTRFGGARATPDAP